MMLRWIAAEYFPDGSAIARAFRFRWRAKLYLWVSIAPAHTLERADWDTWFFPVHPKNSPWLAHTLERAP